MAEENAVQSESTSTTEVTPSPVGEQVTSATKGAESGSPQVETGSPAPTQPESITLSETGDLSIPDSFVSEAKEVIGRHDVVMPQQQPQQVVNAYSPEEFGVAAVAGNLDVARIPPELKGFYDAYVSRQQQLTQLSELGKPQEPVQPQQPLQMPQKPVRINTQALSPEDFAAINKAGKSLAAKYLNIAENDFDEFNPAHTNALQIAVQNIRTRAEQIADEKYKTDMAQYDTQVKQVAQAYQQQRINALQPAIAEFMKNPDYQDISEKYFHTWLGRLRPDVQQRVVYTLSVGLPQHVKAVMDVIVNDYKSDKSAGRFQSTARPQPVNVMALCPMAMLESLITAMLMPAYWGTCQPRKRLNGSLRISSSREAIVMGANTYVAIGNADDISNIITMISPSDTPIMSASKRTKATGVFHTWLEDALATPGTNTQPEGGPLLASDPAPRTMLGNWTQILERGYQVTGTQEVVAKHGLKSELAYQMQKCAKELALDYEWALINNGAGSAGVVATKIRKFTSLDSFITTNNVAVTGALTEASINAAVQAAWTAGGDPKRAYMSANNKRVASTFSNPDRQVSQSEKKLTRTIRFYESDFGLIEMIPHRLMPDTKVLVLDPTYVAFADLRPVHKEVIAKTTDSVNGVLLGESTLEVRAEKAHAKITLTAA